MLVITILMVLLLVTLAVAMAGRNDPPPQRKDRTEERNPPRQLAPDEGPQPPLGGSSRAEGRMARTVTIRTMLMTVVASARQPRKKFKKCSGA